MEAIEVSLPGGVPLGEQWCRSAWLRPLTGYEEEFLLGAGRLLSPAARVTQLLARCLQRLGPVEPVGPEEVRQLAIGDREALLLHLRRLTLGEGICCLLSCPQCAKMMDLELTISELLLPPYAARQLLHETQIIDGEESYKVIFRLPNGEDQEAVIADARESVDAAVLRLLSRCVVSATTGRGEPLSSLPTPLVRELPGRIARLDPQAEVLFDLICPECNSSFVVPFDVSDYVCRELAAGERGFYREVHALSFHYQWSEQSILALSRRKRRIYVELLGEEMAGVSRGV
jgi:hypothetical protein